MLDYASLDAAFVSLAEITGAELWRQRAALLANAMLNRFARADGSFSTAPNEKDLLVPIADTGDMEMPPGTSMAIDLLVRLQEASGGLRFRDVAARTVTRLSGQFQDHPGLPPSTLPIAAAVNSQ